MMAELDMKGHPQKVTNRPQPRDGEVGVPDRSRSALKTEWQPSFREGVLHRCNEPPKLFRFLYFMLTDDFSCIPLDICEIVATRI